MLAQEAGDAGFGAGLLIVAIVLYFVPTVIGMIRGVRNIGSIIVLNLFLGWTLVGWVVALAMAASTAPAKTALAETPQVPGRPDAGQVTWTHTGVRYTFAYSVHPPEYQIWDRTTNAVVDRFPYTEHGQQVAFARYMELAPEAVPVVPPAP